MGLFSSIGSFIGGDLLGSVGGIVDDALGMSSSKKANSQKQANYNQQMQLALRQQQFNEDYVKNALQWRVDDAQKAGLHPMAVLGLSSPSAGGVSSLPSIDTYNPIDMGQSTNYAATKAKDRQQQAKMVELQMRGLALDNEYKQAQIDALKADTLASSITSNQALQSPSGPTVNAKEPNNGIPSDSSVTSGTSPLLGASRVGNSVMLHINPDISDSITEDMARNLAANIAAEAQMGRISPEILSHFSQRERDAVARGDAVIEYSPPSQFFFRWKGHMQSRKNPDGSISGKIIF